MFFRVVTPCRSVGCYQHFCEMHRTANLIVYPEFKTVRCSETFVTVYNIAWRHNAEGMGRQICQMIFSDQNGIGEYKELTIGNSFVTRSFIVCVLFVTR